MSLASLISCEPCIRRGTQAPGRGDGGDGPEIVHSPTHSPAFLTPVLPQTPSCLPGQRLREKDFTFRPRNVRGYTSLPLAAGENMKVVQELLGHSRFSTTADTYAHTLPDQQSGKASRPCRS